MKSHAPRNAFCGLSFLSRDLSIGVLVNEMARIQTDCHLVPCPSGYGSVLKRAPFWGRGFEPHLNHLSRFRLSTSIFQFHFSFHFQFKPQACGGFCGAS